MMHSFYDNMHVVEYADYWLAELTDFPERSSTYGLLSLLNMWKLCVFSVSGIGSVFVFVMQWYSAYYDFFCFYGVTRWWTRVIKIIVVLSVCVDIIVS